MNNRDTIVEEYENDDEMVKSVPLLLQDLVSVNTGGLSKSFKKIKHQLVHITGTLLGDVDIRIGNIQSVVEDQKEQLSKHTELVRANTLEADSIKSTLQEELKEFREFIEKRFEGIENDFRADLRAQAEKCRALSEALGVFDDPDGGEEYSEQEEEHEEGREDAKYGSGFAFSLGEEAIESRTPSKAIESRAPSNATEVPESRPKTAASDVLSKEEELKENVDNEASPDAEVKDDTSAVEQKNTGAVEEEDSSAVQETPAMSEEKRLSATPLVSDAAREMDESGGDQQLISAPAPASLIALPGDVEGATPAPVPSSETPERSDRGPSPEENLGVVDDAEKKCKFQASGDGEKSGENKTSEKMEEPVLRSSFGRRSSNPDLAKSRVSSGLLPPRGGKRATLAPAVGVVHQAVEDAVSRLNFVTHAQLEEEIEKTKIFCDNKLRIMIRQSTVANQRSGGFRRMATMAMTENKTEGRQHTLDTIDAPPRRGSIMPTASSDTIPHHLEPIFSLLDKLENRMDDFVEECNEKTLSLEHQCRGIKKSMQDLNWELTTMQGKSADDSMRVSSTLDSLGLEFQESCTQVRTLGEVMAEKLQDGQQSYQSMQKVLEHHIDFMEDVARRVEDKPSRLDLLMLSRQMTFFPLSTKVKRDLGGLKEQIDWLAGKIDFVVPAGTKRSDSGTDTKEITSQLESLNMVMLCFSRVLGELTTNASKTAKRNPAARNRDIADMTSILERMLQWISHKLPMKEDDHHTLRELLSGSSPPKSNKSRPSSYSPARDNVAPVIISPEKSERILTPGHHPPPSSEKAHHTGFRKTRSSFTSLGRKMTEQRNNKLNVCCSLPQPRLGIKYTSSVSVPLFMQEPILGKSEQI